MVALGALNLVVHKREIELTLFGFEQLPWDGGQDGVEVHGTIRGQIGFRNSELEELELRSSPASIRNGLPSTISWVAVPCF